MLEKTIKSVITKKIADWVSTITDPEVAQAIQSDIVVTGGCLTSLMQNERPKDYDVYFRTKETVMKVARYYVDLFNKENGRQYTAMGPTQAFVLSGDMIKVADGMCELLDPGLQALFSRKFFHCNTTAEGGEADKYYGMSRMLVNTPPERVKIFVNSNGIAESTDGAKLHDMALGDDPAEILAELDSVSMEEAEQGAARYAPVFLSTNAITLSHGIQVVVRFYGDPETIHETYDFVHTKAYWSPGSDPVLSIPREVYEAVHNKTLIYTGSRYPLCSIIRMRKFIKRGWNINAGQILKMCLNLNQLDLNNIDVLEDQLVGVDSLYFTALIQQFRDKKLDDPSWELTPGYVMSVIDKIFG